MATYLHRTQGTSTSTKKFTFSCWIKNSAYTGNLQGFLSFKNGWYDASGVALVLEATSIINAYTNGNSHNRTTRVFRDSGAWMHLVFAADTTQATQADRMKIYVNGVQESYATSNLPAQNADWIGIANGERVQVGNGANSAYPFFGSMAHIHFIDGTAYAASTFGETDSTSGIWTPKTAPSVTYGNNGFFLKFENSGAMGTDSSGNSNNFTLVGTLTQNVDTPNNNFATFNPIYKANSNPTYTNGNLTATSSGSGYRVSFSTLNNSTGKWYAEFKRAVGSSDEVFIGVSGEIDVNTSFGTNDRYMGETSKSIGIASGNGSSYIAGSATTYAASYGTNDIIGIALDLTNKKLYASKNGAWSNGSGAWSSSTFDAAVGAIDISSLIPSGELGYIGCSNTGTSTLNANFGQGFFGTTAVASANADANGNGIMEYPVPSGYYTLNTKNIKEFG